MEMILYIIYGHYFENEVDKVDKLGSFLNRAAAESVKENIEKKFYDKIWIEEVHEFLE